MSYIKNEILDEAPRDLGGKIDQSILGQKLNIDFKEFIDYNYDINSTNLIANMNQTKTIKTKNGFDKNLNNNNNNNIPMKSTNHVSAS